jgi:hypothetical protein
MYELPMEQAMGVGKPLPSDLGVLLEGRTEEIQPGSLRNGSLETMGDTRGPSGGALALAPKWLDLSPLARLEECVPISAAVAVVALHLASSPLVSA